MTQRARDPSVQLQYVLQGCMKFVPLFISPVHIHTIRPHLTRWLSASKEDSVLKTATVNSGISSRAIVESLLMKNPVPIPAEMATDRIHVLFRCFCSLSGWRTQNVSKLHTSKPARIFSIVDYRVQYKIEEAKMVGNNSEN